MSARSVFASVVIEWSPGSVTAYDSASNRTAKGRALSDVIPFIGSRDVLMAVGRRACFVRSVNVPDAPKQDLIQALTMSIGQHVPIGTGDACVDIRLVGDVTPEGRTATLVAMKAADLRTLQDEAKQAGLRIIATVPAAFGSWILANGSSLKDCAAVSEGAEGLNLDLISGGELRYSRALPPDASNGHLAPELLRTFNAAGLKPTPTFAEGVSVSTADYNVAKSPLEALSGTAWAAPGVEFELPETVQAKSRSGRLFRARLAGALFIFGILLAGLTYYTWGRAQQAVSDAQAKSNRLVTALRQSASNAQADANNEAAMASVLQRGFEPGQRLSDIVALVSNDLPKNAWLTNVSVSRGEPVVMRGTATNGDNVATYLNTLAKETRLRDVKLIFANNTMIESTPVVQFSISAFPVANLPLVDKNPKGGAK